MSKESKEQIREPRAPYTAAIEAAVEERILDPLTATSSPLSPQVKQAVQIIQEFQAREREQFLFLLPDLLDIPPKDYAWLKAAESAFEFWDNEEDAIYDQL